GPSSRGRDARDGAGGASSGPNATPGAGPASSGQPAPGGSALQRLERERVALAVAEERHPQLALRQPRDEVRRLGELDPARAERLVRLLDIRDLEVEDRARWLHLPVLGLADQQSDAGAIEERHLGRRVEQVAEPEGIAIEALGALDVLGGERDL